MRLPKGYTLVELMITIAILSVIVAIAIPAYNGYITEARIATARSNIDSLRLFLEDYRLDNNCYTVNCGAATSYSTINAIQNVFGWNPRQDDTDLNYVLSVSNTGYSINVTYAGGFVNCDQASNCTYSD